jgi:DUF4097 and DUF4098 domain-containing protein YvlB
MKTLLIAGCALLLSVGSAAAQQQVNERLSTAATGEVEIVNTAGSVRVTGWDRNEIQVTGTLGQGTERLDITPSGNRVQIRVVLPRNARNVKGSDLEIRVPARKDVGVRTVSADITVSGIRGMAEAQAVSGDVEISGSPREVSARSTSGDVGVSASNPRRVDARSVSGSVRVRGAAQESIDTETVSGDIDVNSSAPEMRAKSVSGSVNLQGVGERVNVSTVSGDARVVGDRIRLGTFESVSGGIRLTGALERGAALTLNSHSGDIELRLPSATAADFEVKTFSGDISNQFGPQAERTSRYGPGRELRFSSGRGDARVNAKTFSGNVKLLKR